jgi:hypothetical protein
VVSFRNNTAFLTECKEVQEKNQKRRILPVGIPDEGEFLPTPSSGAFDERE